MNTNNLNILIADDFPLMRKKLIELLLEAYPSANIKEVNNGDEALEQINKASWNLVLMDFNMPGQNGLEVLKKLKKLRTETPVLILSLNSAHAYALKAIKSGASGFLTKESSSEELVSAIKEILAGEKYISKALSNECCMKENVEHPSFIKLYHSN